MIVSRASDPQISVRGAILSVVGSG